jgi:hypothetical protein
VAGRLRLYGIEDDAERDSFPLDITDNAYHPRLMPFLMPDISHWQVQLDQARAKQVATVASAIMLKSTQGTSFVDPHFLGNVRAVSGVLPWGPYHFIDSRYAGKTQAEHFVHTVRLHGRPDFWCIDWEQGSRTIAVEALKELAVRVSEPIILYSGHWARENGGYVKPYPALVPAYGGGSLSSAYVPKDVPLAAWQYTNGKTNGTAMPSSIPGIGNCDISVVYRPDLLGIHSTDTGQEANDMANADDWITGFEMFVAGEKEPADGWTRRGYRRAQSLYNQAVKDASGGTETVTIEIPSQTVKATVTKA